MTGQRRARLGAALAIGAIWLGAVAAPASAATTTVRYVDDNTGRNACHGTNFHSIQAAIDASNAKDIVYVCPGTYTEQLSIDVPNLTVQSLSFQKAHIRPPASTLFPAVVEIWSDGVKFRGFKLDIPAGPLDAAPGSPMCDTLEAAVVVLGNRAGIWGNYIDSIGDNSLSGECGYDTGILFLGNITATAAPALGSDRSTAKRNYIRDFKIAGILAEGPDVSVRLWRNAIRFVHQDDPATCVPVNTFQAGPSLTPPCERAPGVNAHPLNGIFGFSTGIGIGAGAKADVGFNTIFSTLDFALLSESQIPLLGGVIFFDAAEGSRITENVISQVFVGVATDPSTGPLAQQGGAGGSMTVGSEISFNRANEGFIGFLINTDGNYVYANRARLNLWGLGTFEGEDNDFIENDARYNFDTDCFDETTGTGTENTANNWQDSLGNNNDPQDICIATGGPF